jgi:hypothetical protein
MAEPAPTSSEPGASGRRRVRRLIGVYHASGTTLGEISYWIGARLGRAHCPLCDITHGTIREKKQWRQCRAQLPVPFETVHLDDRGALLARLTDGHTPCVVAETDAGFEVLVGRSELETCEGSPTCLIDIIVATARERGLVLGE